MPIKARHRDFVLELRHTFRLSRGASDQRRNVLLELDVGDHVGLGEAAPIGRYNQNTDSVRRSIDRMMSRLGDPRCFDSAVERAGVPDQPAASAAVDMALWDLHGKRLGVPLYELLGLDAGTMPPTSFTIGIDRKDVVVEKVRAASQFEILKVKLGTEDDEPMLAAVHEAGDQRLRVDANEGWTLAQAKDRLDWLAGLGIELIEQPLPAGQLDEMRALRAISPVPLVADESLHRAEDIPGLVGAFDGINIKLMKCGGISEALRMIHVARACGLRIMLGCMIESSLAITAAAHLAPLVDWVDLDGNLLVRRDPFVGARVRNGNLQLPSEPGLGVRPRYGPEPCYSP